MHTFNTGVHLFSIWWHHHITRWLCQDVSLKCVSITHLHYRVHAFNAGTHLFSVWRHHHIIPAVLVHLQDWCLCVCVCVCVCAVSEGTIILYLLYWFTCNTDLCVCVQYLKAPSTTWWPRTPTPCWSTRTSRSNGLPRRSSHLCSARWPTSSRCTSLFAISCVVVLAGAVAPLWL